MTDETSCRHPDCIYRNRGDEYVYGNCKYLDMTGHSRTAGLPERLRLPCNCPRYIPDGTDPAELLTRTWQDEAMAFYRAGATDKEIERALKLPRGRFSRWRNKKGLPVNKEPPHYQFDWERGLSLYSAGANDREIAEALGCTVSAARLWRDRLGLPANGKPGRPRKKPQSQSAQPTERQEGEAKEKRERRSFDSAQDDRIKGVIRNEDQGTGRGRDQGKAARAV